MSKEQRNWATSPTLWGRLTFKTELGNVGWMVHVRGTCIFCNLPLSNMNKYVFDQYVYLTFISCFPRLWMYFLLFTHSWFLSKYLYLCVSKCIVHQSSWDKIKFLQPIPAKRCHEFQTGSEIPPEWLGWGSIMLASPSRDVESPMFHVLVSSSWLVG